MTATKRQDPPTKALARLGYRKFTDLRASLFGRAGKAGEKPMVFYSGARSGDQGGPLVKVQRLQTAFPQSMASFNTVYSLSNAPYLSHKALEKLKARDVGIVHNQNGVFYPGWFDGDWQAQNARMSSAYQLADHVFWQSSFCRNCADAFLGTRSAPGEVLFNAVDINHFSPAKSSAQSERPFAFLLTGKIQAHLSYRLEDSIGGLASARASGLDATLTIAGVLDSGARDAANAAAQRHGVTEHVTFAGPYVQAEAPDIYRQADAYVMTKHADPCPNTVIEAMACGLPVVYVASGGVPELVGPDAGAGVAAHDDWEQLFRPDPDALGIAMANVANHAAPMGKAARKRAEDAFNLKAWIARHAEVFEQLLENKSFPHRP